MNTTPLPLTRRDFIALAGAAAVTLPVLAPTAGAAEETAPAAAAPARQRRRAGLELYSVRGELARDLPATLRAVAGMGYEIVEFYSPYFDWSFPYAKDVRTQLDDLGLHCVSTHNHIAAFTGDTIGKAIELSQILGVRHVVLASAPRTVQTLEDWKGLCGQLTAAAETFRAHGLSAGYHNHQAEWAKLDGDRRIIDFVAANTPPDFVLQLDVGTCLEAGMDPVAWIKSNPGRIRNIHLKDWAPAPRGYHVLFGEGVAPWGEIIAAAESVGGVEVLLIEQEGSSHSELETAKLCLESFRKQFGA